MAQMGRDLLSIIQINAEFFPDGPHKPKDVVPLVGSKEGNLEDIGLGILFDESQHRHRDAHQFGDPLVDPLFDFVIKPASASFLFGIERVCEQKGFGGGIVRSIGIFLEIDRR